MTVGHATSQEATQQADETLVWLHIPKTAGTSMVAEVFRLGVPWNHVFSNGTARDHLKAVKDDALCGKFRVMIGHMTHRDFADVIGDRAGFRFATMLRHPVDRILSQYRYITSSPARADRDHLADRFPTFASFVDHDVDCNVMAHYLELYRGEKTEQIVRRLIDSYRLVGFVDRYHEASNALRGFYGLAPAEDLHLNVSPRPKEPIPSAVLRKIKERNWRDFEIFEQVSKAR